MAPAKKPRRLARKAPKIGGFRVVDITAQQYRNRKKLLESKPTPRLILEVLRRDAPKDYFLQRVDLSNAKISPDLETPAINIFFHQKTRDRKMLGLSMVGDFPGIGPVPINFINTIYPKLVGRIEKHERQHVRTYTHRRGVKKEGIQVLSEAAWHELVSYLAEKKHITSKKEIIVEIKRLRRRMTKKIDSLIEVFRESGYKEDLLQHIRANNLAILERNLKAICKAMEFLPLGEIRMVIANSHWSLIEADLQKRIALVQKYKERKKNR